MRTTLRLIAAKSANREIAAWFVPGDDPRAWFTELSRWQVALESLRYLPIPRSDVDVTTIGMLVIVSSGSGSRVRSGSNSDWAIRTAKRAIPYARVTGRLLIPIDAEFSPAVIESELEHLLSDPTAEYVWHPSAGLVQLEAADQLRLADLLHLPPERTKDWDRAQPGVAFASRLISIEPEEVLSVEQILKSAASDIGSRDPSIDRLPRMPGEPFGGKLNEWTQSIKNAWKKLIGDSKEAGNKQPPGTSDGTTAAGNSGPAAGDSWGAKAGGLIGKGLGLSLAVLGAPLIALGALGSGFMKMTGLNSLVDQAARNLEIDRLLHLLKTDPDTGLQFALPMGGDDSRGIASPSNQLVGHGLNFSLGGLQGGGGADAWDIEAEKQRQLIENYRELAAREIRLGRHRRAAYIYAQLLRDLVSAAGALEAGHHYHEAAVLYRDRLNRPTEAARCLELGGMLDDAVQIYLDQGMFEKAAELYVRLDRPDEAEQLLRTWADHLASHGDYRNASRVLHDKLHDLDGALKALLMGWPTSTAAQFCLEETFRLLGQHAQHDSAKERIAEFQRDATTDQIVKTAVAGLTNVATSFPERTVQSQATDAVYVLVGQSLRTANMSDAGTLLSAVRRLEPEDRLLARDCGRYMTARQQPAKPVVTRRFRGIQPTGSFLISLDHVKWRTAKSTGKSVYLVGYGRSSLIVQRLEWDNTAKQNQRAFWAGVSDARSLILDPYPHDAGDVILHAVGAAPLDKRGVLTTRGSANRIVTSKIGSPAWATDSTVAMAYTEGGVGWRIRVDFGSLVLASFSPQGEPWLVEDLKIGIGPQEISHARINLVTSGKEVRVSIEQFICRPIWRFENSEHQFELQHETVGAVVHGLAVSRAEDGPWLLALFETGACLIDDDDFSVQIHIGQHLASPVGAFLRGGQFVLIGGKEVQAYDIVRSEPVLIGECTLAMNPVAVTATDELDEFAVVGEDGTVEKFRIRHM